jgi:PHS family inorganic phosphate transporter-like MFS transporter
LTPGATGDVPAVYETLKNLSIGNIIICAAGLIPGYGATFLWIEKAGRRAIQLRGFVLLGAIFLTLGKFVVSPLSLFLLADFIKLTLTCGFSFPEGWGYDKLTATPGGTTGFVVLCCFANFFQNFGPNTITFIVPAEVFPTRYRATAHGIAGAAGRLGAIIAQAGFGQLKDRGGPNHGVKVL